MVEGFIAKVVEGFIAYGQVMGLNPRTNFFFYFLEIRWTLYYIPKH
jgi:hypothetical protein